MVAAKPNNDPERIAPLFERLIERLNAGYGIDAVRLQALKTEPLKPEQTEQFDRAKQCNET